MLSSNNHNDKSEKTGKLFIKKEEQSTEVDLTNTYWKKRDISAFNSHNDKKNNMKSNLTY